MERIEKALSTTYFTDVNLSTIEYGKREHVSLSHWHAPGRVSCEEAAKLNFTEIYIGVMIQNERALNWYRKLGFDFFEEQPFTMGKTSVPHLIGRKILDK